jgi:hypothetical protein
MTRMIKAVPASFDPPDDVSTVAAVPDDVAQSAAPKEQAEPERAGPEPGDSGLVDERSR